MFADVEAPRIPDPHPETLSKVANEILFVMIMKHGYNPLPYMTSNITAQDVEDP